MLRRAPTPCGGEPFRPLVDVATLGSLGDIPLSPETNECEKKEDRHLYRGGRSSIRACPLQTFLSAPVERMDKCANPPAFLKAPEVGKSGFHQILGPSNRRFPLSGRKKIAKSEQYFDLSELRFEALTLRAELHTIGIIGTLPPRVELSEFETGYGSDGPSPDQVGSNTSSALDAPRIPGKFTSA